MPTFDLAEAAARLDELLDLALAGEEIVIARGGLQPVRLAPLAAPTPRQPGIARGRVTDAFFQPLPDDELDS